MMPLIGRTDELMFKLDAEDLEYLYNKYSKQVCKERDDNVKKVIDEYKNC